MPLPLIEIPPRADTEEVDEDILEIFVEEVEEVLQEITENHAKWEKNPADKEAGQTLRRAFHTLKGSGRMVGAMVIGELGWCFESMFNRLTDGTMKCNTSIIKLVEQVQETIPALVEEFKSDQSPGYDALLLISQADHITQTKGESLGEFESPSGGEEAKAEEMKPAPARAPEIAAAPAPEPASEEEEEEIDPEILRIFRMEAGTHLRMLKSFLIKCRKKSPCVISDEVVRTLHTLNGSSRSVGILGIAALAAPMETFFRGCLERKLAVKKKIIVLFIDSGKMIESMVANGGQSINTAALEKLTGIWKRLINELPPLPHAETFKPAEAAMPAAPPPPPKAEPVEAPMEAPEEMIEIFLEEAEEILETSQSLVGRWEASPNSMPLLKELQRELHTLKGGSRMVGITAMGDLSHHLESVLTRIVEGRAQSNPQLQSIVQESLDELASMLEAIRTGAALQVPADLIAQIDASLAPPGKAEKAPPPKSARQKTPPPKAEKTLEKAPGKTLPEKIEKTAPPPDSKESPDAEERIRVRATLIDKLTNLAGEMSISRAEVDQQHGAFKTNLAEMEQTVIRLRDQLRRLYIETEAQILSHFVPTAESEDDEEFDPLEMDRFSGVQQLSRALMESVNDLQDIQEGMQNVLRHSDDLLTRQSRLGTELQDGIMHTRMVPFSQISPRLQRIARLTSKELHKRVDFSINDESFEFERTVLNRAIAPLEHMLRNAIGHGIETTEVRERTGKSKVAKVHIDLQKEGAELVMRLSDDGTGLNMDAIRKKAEARDLVRAGERLSEQELSQLILKPGFSTADSISQIQGRGVGMDIVNSEIKELGGTLEIFSKAGRGTTFEVRLPLSLTISQALLVHLGEETMAIPLPNVDAILRIPRQEADPGNGEENRYYRYMDQEYRLIHLGDLMGFGRQGSVDTALLPILLVRSGEQRVALLVDGVEGSREVVVKSVGPQLGSISWIAGATVLGDGRVVIILDILTLMRVNLAQQQRVTVQIVEPELEKPSVKTIMVVDDSITVRKVTARLLKRQGMDVLTAKDGVDAVAQLQDHKPDLVLLDVEMPRMDGFELATQMRNTDNLKDIPIIMVTSRTGVKHRERARKIGIDKHLGKPFNETELLQNINNLLDQ